ncbi:coniferyl aldehyde dehydrogenase [Paracoccus sp. p3-h83]|uniref:coniferyl aldehyde dehydrogenase n=1 Tax=Paracoccus sp. p3-h83 TaxID=3342805 RepID=UPI0035BB78A2
MTDLRARFDRMMAAARANPSTPWDLREKRLKALLALVTDHEGAIAKVISEDFGQRARAETNLAEIFPTITGIRHALRHGKRWMRPRRAPISILFRPASNQILPQPLGLVGIVAPWNYPLFLITGPLTSAFVAGNRAMVKASESVPRFADWLAATAPRYFDEDDLAIITGGPDVAQAFGALPFDHLLFTGSTQIGRQVMAAAAPNLTPVTLELGGKSPVIITDTADLDHAVARIMTGKLLNAGQTCVAPDYVLIPRPMMDDFIARSKAWVAKHYPKIAKSADYTRIINDRQFSRLTGLLDQANDSGAVLHPLTDAHPDAASRLLPPVIVTGAAMDGDLMQQEIFGPILPVIPTDGLPQAIATINARPRPLALYVFARDLDQIAAVQSGTVAGGVCINETIMHVAQDDLPFGGIGDSGMGAYHGQAGFDTFSHLKPVFHQARWNGLGLLAPPYGPRFKSMMRLIRKLG